MANEGYPYTYPPTGNNGYSWSTMPRPQTQTVVPPVNNTQPVNNLVWLQGGVNAARNYPVVPGGTMFIMDADNPVLYIKSVDSTGRPLPLEIYDLNKRRDPSQEQAVDKLSEYAKVSDVKAMIEAEVKAALEKALA